MKKMFKSEIKTAALCVMAAAAMLASCDDNDDRWSWQDEAPSLELSRIRWCVLIEGAYGEINAPL